MQNLRILLIFIHIFSGKNISSKGDYAPMIEGMSIEEAVSPFIPNAVCHLPSGLNEQVLESQYAYDFALLVRIYKHMTLATLSVNQSIHLTYVR